MALTIRRLGYALGAEITGLDLSKSLTEDTVSEIRSAWLQNILLCFPGQRLQSEEYIAFFSCFGELESPASVSVSGILPALPDHPALHLVVNKPITVGGKEFRQSFADEWHSDESYTDRPKTATFLVGVELPDVGGNTMFANMYMAYESLSPAFKRTIDSLECVHDASLSPDFQKRSPEEQAERRRRRPPMVHPLVRVHPETGRKCLFVGHQVRKFVGMTEEESQPLLAFLNQHATRHEFIYRHSWNLNDILVWDNRCALHITVLDYDLGQHRRLQRCTLLPPKTGYVYTGDDSSGANHEGAAPEVVPINTGRRRNLT